MQQMRTPEPGVMRASLLAGNAVVDVAGAPGIDPAHWPSMAQPTWASALYEFYGVEPYHEG